MTNKAPTIRGPGARSSESVEDPRALVQWNRADAWAVEKLFLN